MTIKLSLLFLLTVVIFIMVRVRHKHDGLTVTEFVICAVWGFLLHESSFAPLIKTFLKGFAQGISGR